MRENTDAEKIGAAHVNGKGQMIIISGRINCFCCDRRLD